jgi:hypothetical protein
LKNIQEKQCKATRVEFSDLKEQESKNNDGKPFCTPNKHFGSRDRLITFINELLDNL